MSKQDTQILAIIGQGYVGLPLAMAAIEAGWTVIGVDSLEAKVIQLNGGHSPVEDVSNDQLQRAIENGLYSATTDYSLVSKAKVITICVPTPLDEKQEPDLTLLRSAATAIAPFVADDTLVVSESTSFPGTLRKIIIPIVNELKPKESQNVYFASAPERVNPGDAVWNQRNTPRLVGGVDESSQVRALDFYKSICDVAIPVTNPEIAEAAKLLENTFRLVNIALINEFTQLCSGTGINVQDVIDAASSKPYGFMPFRPGVGVGGHCIPVDPLYLTWWARQNGTQATFVEAAHSINHAMPKYVAKRALALVKQDINKPKVLILGVAYKPGVSDVRETPVLELKYHLKQEDADVAWHDPLVSQWEDSESVDLNWECDVAILATNQPGLELSVLLSRGVKILDCTNTIIAQPGVFPL